MTELTLGEASALIAAGIAILQFIIPNALALILTGNLSDSHSAVTWSVVSRFLLSSDWPLFLRSETTASTAVARKISFVTWLKPIGLFVAAIAAVVTPLGLHDGVFPGTRTQDATFIYAADRGPMGAGTPARSENMGFSRTCPVYLCPGEPDLGNATYITVFNYTNTTVSNKIRSPELPQFLIDLYQSGIQNTPSVSGFFGIQYRQWQTLTSPTYIDNSTYITPIFKMLGSSVMEGKYKIADGVIIDTVDGAIGFRNHSVPTGLLYGAEWEEDILFLEPDSVCVNTNITAFMAVPDTYSSVQTTSGIIDRGGFVNLNRTRPYPDQPYPFMDGQRNPKLYERAYFAAWLLNVFTMQFLNITDPHTNLSRISSTLNQRYLLNNSFSAADWTYLYRSTSLNDVTGAPYANNYWNGTYNYTSNPEIPNPHNVTADSLTDILTYCETTYPGDPVNITELAVNIGLVSGIGYRTDSGFEDSTDVYTRNSTWERSINVCAGATRVKIRTIRFRYNSTIDNVLEGLSILSVREKAYDTSSSEFPIWGYETPMPKWNVTYINPLWGIIDPKQSQTLNMTTIQSPQFYIPHSQESVGGLYSGVSTTGSGGDNMPGICAPPDLWSAAMKPLYDSFDYSGKGNQQLWMFWKALAQNETGISKSLRLIWTDMAGNYLVGATGIHTGLWKQPSGNLSKRATTVNGQGVYPVYILQHRIRYHWIYGIPALVCISIVAAAVLFACYSMMCGRGTVGRLRHYLFHITSGRVFASFVYPEHHGGDTRHVDTKQWIKEVGHKPIKLFGKVSGPEHEDTCHCESVDIKKADYVRVRQRDDPDTNVWI